jgi:hypothetical protein
MKMLLLDITNLRSVGRLDRGRVLARHHGPAVDGLALGEHVGVSLGGRLVLVQPLEGGALRGRAVGNLNLHPVKTGRLL